MLWNSFLSSLVTTIVSVSIALLLAWCVNRSNIRHKGVWSVIFTLPMLIPSISHGMGLTLLFGDNGLFYKFNRDQHPFIWIDRNCDRRNFVFLSDGIFNADRYLSI